MDQSQLNRFKRWFDEYTSRFFGDDDYINANLKHKQQHTYRVCQESVLLAHELALDEDQTRTAELIALLHDTGRFPQFAQYRTFSDPRSVNHCHLGVQVLRQEGILDVLPRQERQWIETAVGLHGRKALPSTLTGQALLFARLIRDADKIDILRVVTDAFKQYQEDPKSLTLEIGLPDEPGYSPPVLDAVLNEQLIDYTELHNLNDAKLCQLGWVYDLNFAASLKRIDQCGFLEELFSLLPEDDGLQQACRKIRQYVDAKLASVP